ncbi:MAG: NfeD family protein, partial [Treponema sp.]|nr:NfeD family protein [Treponema sp.]
DFVLPRFDWEWNFFGRNVVVVTIGIIAAITGIAVIALLGPRIKLFDGLTLKTRITGTASGPLTGSLTAGDSQTTGGSLAAGNGIAGDDPEGSDEGEYDYAALLGREGSVTATLRPTGKAEIDGQIYVVEAEGAFIEPGNGVKVTRVRGNRIIVRPV